MNGTVVLQLVVNIASHLHTTIQKELRLDWRVRLVYGHQLGWKALLTSLDGFDEPVPDTGWRKTYPSLEITKANMT